MKKNLLIYLAAVGIIGSLYTGCEIGTNPLILDSSIGDSIMVDWENAIVPPPEIPFPPVPLVVNMETLRDVTDDRIEKVSFYNMTLKIENIGTPDSGKITGRLMVDGDTLAAVENLSISVFSKERSIFENIPGFRIYEDALGTVLRAVKDPPAGGIGLQMYLGPTNTEINFILRIKVYGQIHTKP